MKSFRFLTSALAFGLTISCCAPPAARAGSATWSSNPTSGDWNTAANWTPATVPNMKADIATFGVSNTTRLLQASFFTLNGILFNPGASAYKISLTGYLTISDAGIVNNSGVTQNVTASVAASGDFGVIFFTDNATTGESVNYDVKGGPRDDYLGGQIWFQDHSSAGSGVFTTSGGLTIGATGSYIYFLDESSATHATFVCNGGANGAARGLVSFQHESTATDVTLISNGGAVGGPNGTINFYGDSLAESAVVVNGTTISGGAYGSFIYDATLPLMDVSVTTNGGPGTESTFGGGASYFDGPSAQGCSFTCHGGNTPDGSGGYTQFSNTFDTGDSVLIASGGTNGAFGGEFYLLDSSVVGGRVELFGNGKLYTAFHDAPGAAIGSLEGDGIVMMGGLNLTVGSNTLSTIFSGTLEGDAGSSLTKIGTGRLTLGGANTYSAGTSVTGGGLNIVNTTGSGTGSGPVAVNVGTLSGGGIIAGAVTIGTGSGPGASLAPVGVATTTMTLTIQSALTFKSDGTYNCVLMTKKPQADQVSALDLTIESGAQFKLQTVGKKRLRVGRSFIVINNTSTSSISGTFANLADGSTVKSGNNHFQVSYKGGDGNDLTLTVVP